MAQKSSRSDGSPSPARELPETRKKWLLVITILCAVAVLTAAWFVFQSPRPASAQPAELIINEVVSSNDKSSVDPTLGAADWVEIYNPTNRDVDLSGYRLTDKLKSQRGLLSGAVVRAGGYLIVYADKTAAKSGAKACSVDFNLAKSGITLYLVNPQNAVVSQVVVPALLTDESWARRADGSFGYCTASTPGKANADADIQATQAMAPSAGAGSLILSEVLPRNGQGDAWAELYNSGKSGVNLSGYCLSDNKDNPEKWRMPDRTLKAGEYAVVLLTGQAQGSGGDLVAPFKLGSQDTSLYLSTSVGALSGSLSWQQGIPEGVSVVAGNKYTAMPTKGAKNSKQTSATMQPAAMDPTDPVHMSELLPRNKYGLMDSDGDREGWVELHNTSNKAVSLSRYYLTDNSDKLFKWALPDRTVAPGGYAVVFLSGKLGKPDELHASFRLPRDDTSLTLVDANNYSMESLPIPTGMPDDVSIGRGGDGSIEYFSRPTPGAANGQGVSELGKVGLFNASGLYISEVCAAEAVKSGQHDWIELHNGGSTAVSLAGYYLSDNASNPKLWKIPSGSIPSGGYAVIPATSNTAGRTAATAAFGVSPDGDTILLSDPGGSLLDAFQTGELSAGLTSGRLEGNDEIARVYFASPTPGKPNTSPYYAGYAPQPVFSENALYQKTPFSLSITTADPNAKIYYTTDGSAPTQASKLYTGPVPVSKNTPVRAVSCEDNLLPSAVTTATFIFDAPHTMPVFCINGNPSQMKIVVNDNQMHYKPEYPCTAEYYDASGVPQVSFPSGVRPKGNWSLTFPQNSMTLMLRSDYGQKSVTYPFFPGNKVTTFSALTLRSSGEDYNAARLRDSFFQTVEKGMDLDGIDTRLAVVYVNGAYWGLFDLDEEQNDAYLEGHYGLQKGSIDRVNYKDVALAGDNREFMHVSGMAESLNMADDAQFAQLAKVVDIDACTDFLVAQTYFANGDAINQRFWRARDYSVKWRPFLFDLDFSMRYNNPSRNVFALYFQQIPTGPDNPDNPFVDNRIFRSLIKNATWRDKFVRRYIQLAETQFDTDRILQIYDGMVAQMKPEMPLHIARWHEPASLSAWQSQIAQLRSALEKRRDLALKQMQSYFHVSDATMQKYIEEYSK